MVELQVEKMYERLLKSWNTLPEVTRDKYPNELSKASYNGDFNAYVADVGSKMIAEDEVLACDPEGSCNHSQALYDAVACGYVAYKDGQYVKTEEEPSWVHPSMRTPEENELAKQKALSGRGGY